MGQHVDVVTLAKRYIDLGFSVIPLRQDKKPVNQWRWHQYQDTRPSRDDNLREVVEVAARCDALALAHGETCGTICVDADTHEARQKLFDAFPDAPWKTVSRQGGHVIFAPPPGVPVLHIRQALKVQMRLPSGEFIPVDIKPQGGYSIAPGSWHDKWQRPYGDMGKWTLEGKARLPVMSADTEILDNHGVRTIRQRAEDYRAGVRRKSAEARAREASGDTLRREDVEDDLLSREWEFSGGEVAPERKERVEAAKAAAARWDGARQGAGGWGHTFRVCLDVVRGYDLTDSEALEALREWNLRCSPPWYVEDLLVKIRSARDDGRAIPLGSRFRPAAAEEHGELCFCEACRSTPPEDVEFGYDRSPASPQKGGFTPYERATIARVRKEWGLTNSRDLKKGKNGEYRWVEVTNVLGSTLTRLIDCGHVELVGKCDDHGAVEKSHLVCENAMCGRCGLTRAREAADKLEEDLCRDGDKGIAVARIVLEGTAGLDAINKSIEGGRRYAMKIAKKMPGAYHWRIGVKTMLVFVSAREAPILSGRTKYYRPPAGWAVESVKLVSAEEAASVLFDVVLEPSKHLKYLANLPFEMSGKLIRDFPHASKRFRRSGGSRADGRRGALPFASWKSTRQGIIAEAASKRKNCCKAGTCEECRKPLRYTARDVRDGTVLYVGRRAGEERYAVAKAAWGAVALRHDEPVHIYRTRKAIAKDPVPIILDYSA